VTASVKDQARAARESVLVVPADDRAAISVTGKDRTSWLNGLVTCDLAKLSSHHAAWGLLVEKKGRIETDLFAIPNGDTLLLAVPAALRDKTIATLDHYLIMEDALLEPSAARIAFAFGPRAAELPGAFAIDLHGGAAILVDPDDASLEDVTFGDAGGFRAARLERGLPWFGEELAAGMYPQEGGIEKLAVSFDKGCYLGQEVVYMLQNRGHVKQKLVALELEGDGELATGAPVTTPDGAQVGDVRSAAGGHAIAMIKFAQTKPGTELRVGDRNAKVRPSDA